MLIPLHVMEKEVQITYQTLKMILKSKINLLLKMISLNIMNKVKLTARILYLTIQT